MHIARDDKVARWRHGECSGTAHLKCGGTAVAVAAGAERSEEGAGVVTAGPAAEESRIHLARLISSQDLVEGGVENHWGRCEDEN